MNHVNDFLLHPRFDALVARFHTKYERRGPDECWPWRDRRNGRSRYGILRTGHRGEQKWPAHRIAWALAHGPIEPRELYVLHQCDNPECVNPAHMFLGTHADNMADRDAKKRAARGEKAGKSKFTDAQILAIRADKRDSDKEIALEYGVFGSVIGAIRRGDSWAHVGGARITVPRGYGEAHPYAVLTVRDVRWIRQRGLSAVDMADALGVSKRTIYAVLLRETWRHVK